MSAFGKYGVGGANPGKPLNAPNEAPYDQAAAAQGTAINTPDTKPEVMPTEGSHS